MPIVNFTFLPIKIYFTISLFLVTVLSKSEFRLKSCCRHFVEAETEAQLLNMSRISISQKYHGYHGLMVINYQKVNSRIRVVQNRIHGCEIGMRGMGMLYLIYQIYLFALETVREIQGDWERLCEFFSGQDRSVPRGPYGPKKSRKI